MRLPPVLSLSSALVAPTGPAHWTWTSPNVAPTITPSPATPTTPVFSIISDFAPSSPSSTVTTIPAAPAAEDDDYLGWHGKGWGRKLSKSGFQTAAATATATGNALEEASEPTPSISMGSGGWRGRDFRR